MLRTFAVSCALGASMLCCALESKADVVFSGTNGSLSASATFSTSGTNLVVKLTNTGSADALVQSNILTAVFFTLNTANPLTLQSAVAGGSLGIYQQNSTVNSNANGSLDSISVANLAAPGSTNGGPGNFDGGWQFRENLGGLPGLTQTRGLGTNGLGIFNGNDVMDVDNEDYALTSAGDDVATSQAKQLFNFPLIKNEITFTLSGLPNGFVLDTTNIIDVRFQYGTSLSEPSITDPIGGEEDPGPGNGPGPGPGPGQGAIPEPASLVLVGALGLLGALGLRRRKSAPA